MSTCALDHAVPKAHLDGCADQACGGCWPAQADQGSRLCAWHEDKIRQGLRELPGLWADLGDPSTWVGGSGGRSGQSGAADGPPLPTTEPRIAARGDIKSTLVGWCKILEDDWAITLPTEDGIRATTRRLITQCAAQAGYARRQITADTTLIRSGDLEPPGIEIYQARIAEHQAQATRMDALAAQHREDATTGADIITALCEHITRQLARILNSEHAESLAWDLLGRTEHVTVTEVVTINHPGVVRTAWRLARPGRPDAGIRVPCPTCAAPVSIRPDHRDDITCRDCGETGDIRWWRTQIAPKGDEPMTGAEIIAWLAEHHRIATTESTLRTWLQRGKVTDQGTDDLGRTLYDPISVAAHAIRRRNEGL